MADNLALWNSVAETDPEHTKKVNARGGFTAISANYQIREATRAFGPIGIGWGYVAGEPIFQDGLIMVPVTLWHGDRANTFGPMLGAAMLVAGNKVDHDAPKKATTDAITKLLSQIGFSADVFLGLYDDNKYVESLLQKKEAEKQRAAAKPKPKPDDNEPVDDDIVRQLIVLLEANGSSTVTALDKYRVDAFTRLTKGQARELYTFEKAKRDQAMGKAA